MLKKPITYENFDGETVTEDHYFNFSKAELVELEVSEKEGFSELLQKVVKAEDGAAIVSNFKKIIMLAYGVRSEDGKRFDKSDEVKKAFMETEAYSALFMQLAMDTDFATEFINGVMPAGMIPSDIPNEVAVQKAKDTVRQDAIDIEKLQDEAPVKKLKDERPKIDVDALARMTAEEFEQWKVDNGA